MFSKKISKQKNKRFVMTLVFVSFLLAIFFAYAVPLAIHADNGTALCMAQSNAGSNIGSCINRIYVIGLAIGGTIAVLFIVIAGYLYMQGGDSVATGKTMLKSTIAGLIILFGTYVFLNTINPDLTTFSGNTLPDVTCNGAGGNSGTNVCTLPSATAPGDGSGGSTPTNTNNNTNALAQTLLSENGSTISFGSGGDCSGNGPMQNITQAANGQPITVDGPSSCGAGTTPTLNNTMLQALQTLQQKGNSFTVTSIASGHHSSASDPHYSGNAVDLVPSDRSVSNEVGNFINVLYANGAGTVAVECDPTDHSGHTYQVIQSGGTDNTGCQNEPGYHIHAQW